MTKPAAWPIRGISKFVGHNMSVIYSDLNELLELCKVVVEYNGSFTAHMRNESFNVVQSVEDCVLIGREISMPTAQGINVLK